YIADGHNGMRVIQLNTPRDPDNGGFSPRPRPELIATYRTDGPALAISEGIDRDRAVDESGNQIAVFGRRGSRALNLVEMMRMYKRDGRVFTVPDIKSGRDIVDSYGPPAGGGAAQGPTKTDSQPERPTTGSTMRDASSESRGGLSTDEPLDNRGPR